MSPRRMRPARPRSTILLLAVVGATLAGCGGGASTTETARAAASAIAFTRSGEIWTMDEDGGNRRRLTPAVRPDADARGAGSPAWSPDRTRIAFASSGPEARDPGYEIYVMNADGSDRRQLTNEGAANSSPTWSPDGKRIAFAHIDSGDDGLRGGILVIDADGGGRAEVTWNEIEPGDDIEAEDSADLYDSAPAWSPDGRLIAFARISTRRLSPTSSEMQSTIRVVEPDGSGERLVVEDASDPAWSPDGARLAFTSFRDRNGTITDCAECWFPSGEIYVAGADGTSLRRLTQTLSNDGSPAWSPDGRRIAFVSEKAIYVLPANGGDVRRVTPYGLTEGDPAWGS